MAAADAALCLPVGAGAALDPRLVASWTYIRMHHGQKGTRYTQRDLAVWAVGRVTSRVFPDFEERAVRAPPLQKTQDAAFPFSVGRVPDAASSLLWAACPQEAFPDFEERAVRAPPLQKTQDAASSLL